MKSVSFSNLEEISGEGLTTSQRGFACGVAIMSGIAFFTAGGLLASVLLADVFATSGALCISD